MRSVYKTHPVHGKCLFIDNGYLEVGIALEFGIRIVHFSFLDGENVFYEQPLDSHAFETPEGWRLRGGHRLWLTPEDKNTYFPDNLPVDHELGNNSVLITQSEDAWLGLLKSVEITLHPKCAEVKHKRKIAEITLENTRKLRIKQRSENSERKKHYRRNE